jgi:hypothetical protein
MDDQADDRSLDIEVATRVMGWEWLTFVGPSEMYGRSVLHSPEDVRRFMGPPDAASFWQRGQSDWHSATAGRLPHYSADIAAAWTIVDEMFTRDRTTVSLYSMSHGVYYCFFGWAPVPKPGEVFSPFHEARAGHPAEAICRAALSYIEQQER